LIDDASDFNRLAQVLAPAFTDDSKRSIEYPTISKKLARSSKGLRDLIGSKNLQQANSFLPAANQSGIIGIGNQVLWGTVWSLPCN